MIETIIAFIFAHVLADFVFHSGNAREGNYSFFWLLLHISLVAMLSFAALGFVAIWAVLIVSSLHLLLDFIKIYFLPQTLWLFLIGQTIHLAIILAVASQFPDAFAGGIWGSHSFWESTPDWLESIPAPWLSNLPEAMLILSGAVFATRAGGVAIDLFLRPLSGGQTTDGKQAGAIIGNLERILVFMFTLGGQMQFLGFLIVAKSVMRFGTVQNDRAASDYLIIGTLISFGWAFGVAITTVSLLGLLD